MIRENGGLLFVRLSPLASLRGAMRRVLTSTKPPEDALRYQRFETKGFLVFLEPGSARRASCTSRWWAGSASA